MTMFLVHRRFYSRRERQSAKLTAMKTLSALLKPYSKRESVEKFAHVAKLTEIERERLQPQYSPLR